MKTDNGKLISPDLPGEAIWLAGGGEKDEYAEFFPDFAVPDDGEYSLRVAADGDFNVYAGDTLCGFGQYADYPGRLVYDDVPLPSGGGALRVLAWHYGIDSQTHVARPAYVAFCLCRDGVPVPGCASSPAVLSRLSPLYVQHRGAIITSQLGPGFSCDGCSAPEPVKPSEAVGVEFSAVLPRPTARLTLGEEIRGSAVRGGCFALAPDASGDTAALMSGARLDCDAGEADGRYFLFDFGRECVGFPDITLSVPAECRVLAAWGEHITDGLCRAAIHSRRFTFEYRAHAGQNRLTPALRRLGCRYIQLFVIASGDIDASVTLLPVLYPVTRAPYRPSGALRGRIYDTACRTLECCMHEHYEDCPWREQALYTLDSRNQMLTGYYCFEGGNAAMARASLDLMSRGVRGDGLLPLCFPAGLDYPIPFYSLAYFIQMNEYAEHTGDLSAAREHYGMLCALLGVFLNRRDTVGEYAGLVRRFPDRLGYWNFYEWSPTMSGDRIHRATPDEALPAEAPLNAALALACRSMAGICRALGKDGDAEVYLTASRDTAAAVRRVFRDGTTGLFRSFTDRAGTEYSVLTQAMCLLCGAGGGADPGGENDDAALRLIVGNGGDVAGGTVIPATLSMACFRYDALLAADREKYAPEILREIDRDGEFMLSRGATTFWETIAGEADFGGAGSLCHGWSAMAAYYYALLGA